MDKLNHASNYEDNLEASKLFEYAVSFGKKDFKAIGYKFYDKYKYSLASKWLELAYEVEQDEGNAKASLAELIAHCYWYGRTYLGAISWGKKAYEINKNYGGDLVASASYAQAFLYLNGRFNFKQDEKKAFKLFLDSAKLGYHEAYKEVAKLYRAGIGIEPDIKRSKYWQTKYNNYSQ